MFKVFLIGEDGAGYQANHRHPTRRNCPKATSPCASLTPPSITRTASPSPAKGPVVHQFRWCPASTWWGRSSTAAIAGIQRSATPVVLNSWGVRGALGGAGAARAPQGRLLVPLPAAFTPQAGDGDQDRQLHRDAVRDGARAPRRDARQGEVLVAGCQWRRGQRGGGDPRQAGATPWWPRPGVLPKTRYLKTTGAARIVDRAPSSQPGRPLGRERWAGAVDSVGSHTLANVCATTRYRGAVAACGLAQGMDLPASVAPFILRGVTLAGVDSVMCPRPDRLEAWSRLARDLDPALLELITHEIGLSEAIPTAAELMAGRSAAAWWWM